MDLQTKEGRNTRAFSFAVRELSALEPGGSFGVSGLHGSSRAFFLSYAFRALKRPFVAILPDEEAAEAFAQDLRFFLGFGDVRLYPSSEILPFDLQNTHSDIASSRVEILDSLITGIGPLFTVVSCQTLMQKVAPRETLRGNSVTIARGREYQRDELIEKLASMGYSRMSLVEERGEMSVRGGILDIFPTGFDAPVRVEFFGDEVESIRKFDLATQRSKSDLDEARILPAGEAAGSDTSRRGARERLMERADELDLPREAWDQLSSKIMEGMGVASAEALLPLYYDRLDTLFDYIGDSALIAFIEPSLVEAGIRKFSDDVDAAAKKLLEKKRFFVPPRSIYLSSDEALTLLAGYPVINIKTLGEAANDFGSESNLDIRQAISVRKGTELLSPLIERIRDWADEGVATYITAHNRGQAERTKELLEGYGLKGVSITAGSHVLEKAMEAASPAMPGLGVAVGAVSGGFRLRAQGIAIVSEEEVFGERVKRRPPPPKRSDVFAVELGDLSTGDFIVHAHHGIGLYRGLQRLTVDGVESDFLLLEYKDGDKLYLPVWRMDLVGKYHGVEGRVPDIDRLGGTAWARKKGKVKKDVEKMAGELLKLYAQRRMAEGFAFSRPERLFHEFEAAFEFDETPDQARAIEETLKDMMEARPMDRLICGDVGYGKTEVAIRAAFKAALDGKQSAVLVPTTVLAQQHYLTFSKRLAPYPVAVDVLSRFKSKKEQKETADKLARGEIDIIIGTHRLLQKDLRFKDLGLIVIDEEHRFGVAQKERLKQLRRSVDCLTLTATPIPRTLHMSLAGIRDLSIINTAPHDRLAIKTSVIPFDEPAITEAIERELKRGGQVFFVHNRIQSIGVVEESLGRLLPNVRIAVAHGRMNEHELEKKMLGFVNKEYDVLLSTAIIESGLDIPSANTIIINRADKFGLAELYQLRGRVGRSSHRAYAYFICPDSATLTDDARKRIEVIQELCDPGSGFRIATYDLEIRGAGELLGTAQSGDMVEVGFEMYTQLLEEAVRELKGEHVAEEPEPEINLKVSRYIPEDYIPDTRQRLGVYKRLATLSTEDELEDLAGELRDRYGDIPSLVDGLVAATALKLTMKKISARELSQKGTRLYLSFGDIKDASAGAALAKKALAMVKKEPKRFRLMPDSKFVMFMNPDDPPLKEARYLLKELLGGCYT